MIKYREIVSISLVLLLQSVALPVIGDEAPAQYHYSDEWTLVSAPPPAGPYRSVNIDPRVPGASAVTTLPLPPLQFGIEQAAPQDAAVAPRDARPAQTAGALPEDAMQNPPAAGIPLQRFEAVAPAEAAADAMRQYPGSRLPAPGQYGRMMPPSPAFNYPAPVRYPRQAGYPGYSNMPPFGYYSPSMRPQEPEVPSPPEFYGRQRGYGGVR